MLYDSTSGDQDISINNALHGRTVHNAVGRKRQDQEGRKQKRSGSQKLPLGKQPRQAYTNQIIQVYLNIHIIQYNLI